MSDSARIDEIARRAAARLAADLDPALPAQVDQELARDPLGRPAERFLDPISLGAMVVSVASLGWTVYHDLEEDRAKAGRTGRRRPSGCPRGCGRSASRPGGCPGISPPSGTTSSSGRWPRRLWPRAAPREPGPALAGDVRSKQGKESTCPCCRGKISGPFATVLIHRAGNAEPSLAAAICADCAGTAEEMAAAGEALARRMGQGG